MTHPSDPSAPPEGFTGFAPHALDFFRELDANQSRDWFHTHKDRYEQTIRDPLGRLVGSLSFAFAAHDIPLSGDAKTSLFRINRDIRFAKDKRPYKTNASAVLSRDGTKRSQGLLYLQFGPEDCFAAAGFYALEPAELERLRRRILAEPDRWRDVEAALAAADLDLMRDDVAVRTPRGFDTEAMGDLAPVVRLKSFIVKRALAADEIRSNDLLDRLVVFAQAAQPLLRFGWAALS
jgi:uncharacterized protein (TIGR02453 family)